MCSLLFTRGTPYDLLITTLSSPCFADPALSSPQGNRESLRALCDDQWVLERSWQPIICLLVARCLASHFSRVPFLMFLPGELFHIWNELLVFLSSDTPIAPLIALQRVYSVFTLPLCFQASAPARVYRNLSPLAKLQGRRFLFSLPLFPHYPRLKGKLSYWKRSQTRLS